VCDAADRNRTRAAPLTSADAVTVTNTATNSNTVAVAVSITVIHLVLVLALQHWLLVNDIHLDPFSKAGVVYGADTTSVLWRSAVRAMHADAPDARVVLLGGDMLAHHFAERALAANRAPAASAVGAVRSIAGDLNAAFPQAQFLVTLGNNDDPCGDYRSETGGPYQAQLARIWAPLVDRRGAAPDFIAQFSRGGYYTARLPIRSERAIVLNSVFWSFLYSGGCFSRPHAPGATELTWLERELEQLPAAATAMVLMHIPPGYDPRGTEIVHRVVAVPFLTPSSNRAVLDALRSRANALRFIVGAHTHRYDFRIVAGVPMLVASSISPIYRNNPAFFVLDVDDDGVLRDVHPYIYDAGSDVWITEPSFDAMYGAHRFTADALTAIAAKIRSDAGARAAWRIAFDAWARMDGGMGRAWLLYACAQTEPDGGYAACAGTANRTRVLVLVTVALLIVFVVGASLLLRRSATRGR
jgi:hypothetical protein